MGVTSQMKDRSKSGLPHGQASPLDGFHSPHDDSQRSSPIISIGAEYTMPHISPQFPSNLQHSTNSLLFSMGGGFFEFVPDSLEMGERRRSSF